MLVVAGELVHRALDHPHLRAISMRDDKFHSLLHQIYNDFRRLGDCLLLLLDILAEGIAAQRDYDSFLFHSTVLPGLFE